MAVNPLEALLAPLQPRERRVAVLMCEGFSSKEIAARVGLTVNTVKVYTSTVYQKTGTHRERLFISTYWKAWIASRDPLQGELFPPLPPLHVAPDRHVNGAP